MRSPGRPRRRLAALARHAGGPAAPVAPTSASPQATTGAPAAAATTAPDALADLDMPGIVERYRRDGFVVVKGFLHGALLQQHRDELDAYIADVVPTKSTDEHFFDGEWSVDGGRGPVTALKYMNKMTERPFFAAFNPEDSQAVHPRWHSMAEALTGSSDVMCNSCEWFNKPPGLSTTTPPHQDNFYFNWKPADEVVTLWVAMDEVDEGNGSLSYLPASHRRGLRPHHASWIKGFSQSISDWQEQDAEAMVEVAGLQPGDLVAHHSECIHVARDNSSEDRTRRAFACVFRGAATVLDDEGYARYMKSAAAQGSGGVA